MLATSAVGFREAQARNSMLAATPGALAQPQAATEGAAARTPEDGAIAADVDSAAAPNPTETAPEATPMPQPLLAQSHEYTVQPGDTVRSIAETFGISNETLIWANDLTDPDSLQAGLQLDILPVSGLIHQVGAGDTVASVASIYGASAQDVITANLLEPPYIIVLGQKLLVPGGYRPAPKPIVPATGTDDDATDSVPSNTRPNTNPADTVQAPAGGNQQAAAIAPAGRGLPVLGNTPQDQFIMSIAPAAVQSENATGVPASVTIAQAILESYWGSSRLSQEANNYFGIKAQSKPGTAGSVTFNVWEVINGQNVMESDAFRKYNSAAESFVDHGLFFTENARYAAAMAVTNNPDQFAREINRAGYATDPAYASKLIALMQKYDLYRYD